MHHGIYILMVTISMLSVFLSGCTDKSDSSTASTNTDSNNPSLAWILKGDYQVVQRFHDLPEEIQTAILPKPKKLTQDTIDFYRRLGRTEEQIKREEQTENSYHCRMAEPNEKFNATDVLDEDLPSRRFITGGFSKDYAFVFYEHGGYGYYQPLVIMKRYSGKSELIFMGTPWTLKQIKSLEDLKSIIKTGEIKKIDTRVIEVSM
jgi:hypothetical protein